MMMVSDGETWLVVSELGRGQRQRVLPRQCLGALAARLDALDLAAVHDELVLLADLHFLRW